MKAEALKQKAAEFLRKAEEAERKEAAKVGKVVLAHYRKGFEGVSIETLKAEIDKALTPKTSKTKGE